MDKLGELKVDFEAYFPSDLPQDWVKWPQLKTVPKHPLEPKLGWPSGTIDILSKACEQKLPRNFGWAAATLPAFALAAKIFKRGVILNDQKRELRTGHYHVVGTDSRAIEELIANGNPVLIDRNVHDAWLSLFQRIPASSLHIFDVSEGLKSLDSLARLRSNQALMAATQWTIVGGGVLGDFASFAASLWDKKFDLVPTTLLSVIDASVGGKTGINFGPFGKNILGTFAFPAGVYIYSDFLKTLPEREMRAGACEALKHCYVGGNRELMADVNKSILENVWTWEVLEKLIRIKLDVVKRDPFEANHRKLLNFGHTLGHALETCAASRDFSLKHGEAVGIGMLYAFVLSEQIGKLKDPSLRQELLASPATTGQIELLRRLDAEFGAGALWAQILVLLGNDKKATPTKKYPWVLPIGWGEFDNSSSDFLAEIKVEDAFEAWTNLLAT